MKKLLLSLLLGAVMVFNVISKVVDDHHGQERALLAKLPPRTR